MSEAVVYSQIYSQKATNSKAVWKLGNTSASTCKQIAYAAKLLLYNNSNM